MSDDGNTLFTFAKWRKDGKDIRGKMGGESEPLKWLTSKGQIFYGSRKKKKTSHTSSRHHNYSLFCRTQAQVGQIFVKILNVEMFKANTTKIKQKQN